MNIEDLPDDMEGLSLEARINQINKCCFVPQLVRYWRSLPSHALRYDPVLLQAFRVRKWQILNPPET